jgi:hypothetical protein
MNRVGRRVVSARFYLPSARGWTLSAAFNPAQITLKPETLSRFRLRLRTKPLIFRVGGFAIVIKSLS